MRDPITIRLGEEEFVIGPMTIDQLSDIELALSGGAAGIPRARAVIAAGLAKDHPEVAADIGSKPATIGEAGEAMGAILRYGGFISDAKPVEAGVAG